MCTSYSLSVSRKGNYFNYLFMLKGVWEVNFFAHQYEKPGALQS